MAFTEVNVGGEAKNKREPRAGIGIIVALSPDNRCLLERGEPCAVLIQQTDWSHVVSLCLFTVRRVWGKSGWTHAG